MKRLTSTWKWTLSRFKRCQRCRRLGAKTYRQRTRYEDDAQNIVTLCPDCRQENDEHWDMMWLEVYSGYM
jgi:hypothetical protein